MRIAIYGAGSIGCYVGGRLAAAGGDVVLIGRPRVREAQAGGLVVTDYRGARLATGPLPFAEGPEGAEGAALVLITVKSQSSQAVARDLRSALGPGATVLSLQNGIGNAAVLAQALGRPVLPGMVGFNVVQQGPAHFHQGTQGDLHAQADPRLPQDLFSRAGLGLTLHEDMAPVLWAKLQLNLNNAINALSGLPLREELADRAFRRCLALAHEELVSLCAEAGQPLARLTPLPAGWLPRVLRLPDPLFRLIAGNMLRIDPLARSSMADDLTIGRPPELEAINGEVARLAERLGRAAPINACLTALVRDAARHRRVWTGDALWRELTR